MSKIACISGVTGQDGAFLSSYLLKLGYVVHGIKRRSSSINTERIDNLYDNGCFHLHYADMNDTSSLVSIIRKTKPNEIYHLAAQSHVKVSFDVPESTVDIGALGTLRLLEAVRILGMEKDVKIYNACSSEMFGKVQEIPQKETTPFYPRSPYACAKVFSFNIGKNYREAYNMFISNGILYNHESELRLETFVTRKISMGVAKIVKGLQNEIRLGNLEAKRDWGYAGEFVQAMHLMLQQNKPDDFIIATGETHSVQEFCEVAFDYVNLNWRNYVVIDERYFRPSEVDLLLGDASKAKNILGWEPKVKFYDLVKLMVDSDLWRLENEGKF